MARTVRDGTFCTSPLGNKLCKKLDRKAQRKQCKKITEQAIREYALWFDHEVDDYDDYGDYRDDRDNQYDYDDWVSYDPYDYDGYDDYYLDAPDYYPRSEKENPVYSISVPGIGNITCEQHFTREDAINLARDYANNKISGRVMEGVVAVFDSTQSSPIAEFEVAEEEEGEIFRHHYSYLVEFEVVSHLENASDLTEEDLRAAIIKTITETSSGDFYFILGDPNLSEPADVDPFREPDYSFPVMGQYIWYGPNGQEGEYATEVTHDGGNRYIVSEYTLLDNGYFRKITTSVEASDHRIAARLGSDHIAEFGGDEEYARELP